MKKILIILLLILSFLCCSCTSKSKFPRRYKLAKDDDFIKENSHFVYIGTADYVIIPTKIQSEIVYSTNGYKDISNVQMFKERRDIKGVAFQSPENITDISYLYYNNTSEKIELKYLDTPNVERMNYTFSNIKVKTLDIQYLETANVEWMKCMFEGSEIEELDFSAFSAPKLITMHSIFKNAKIKKLNLSGFPIDSLEKNFSLSGATIDEIDTGLIDFTSKQNDFFTVLDNAIIKKGYTRTEDNVRVLNKHFKEEIFSLKTSG